jgi:hypothetical protein
MEKKITNEALFKEAFPITSVSRADLEGEGYDTSAVDDTIMSRLAEKMANTYVENSFWIDLGIIADDLGIPKK